MQSNVTEDEDFSHGDTECRRHKDLIGHTRFCPTCQYIFAYRRSGIHYSYSPVKTTNRVWSNSRPSGSDRVSVSEIQIYHSHPLSLSLAFRLGIFPSISLIFLYPRPLIRSTRIYFFYAIQSKWFFFHDCLIYFTSLFPTGILSETAITISAHTYTLYFGLENEILFHDTFLSFLVFKIFLFFHPSLASSLSSSSLIPSNLIPLSIL